MEREKLLKIVKDRCYNISGLAKKLKVRQQYLSGALHGSRKGETSEELLKKLETLLISL